ncbi:MAG: hypothetical protein KIT73_17215, partial [Burkholderiales bacterium]|nr:hypothetical protein [Burkholderiales bacterium]
PFDARSIPMFSGDHVELRLRPASRVAIALVLLHATAAAVPWALPAPWILQVTACAGVVTLGAAAVWHDGLRRGRGALRSLRIDADRRVRIIAGDGSVRNARLVSSATALPGLLILWGRDEQRRPWRCVATADSVDPGSLRRARVFLRWKVAPSDPGSPV